MKAFLGGLIIGGTAVGAAAYFVMEAEQSSHETIRTELEARLASAEAPVVTTMIPEPSIAVTTLGDRPIRNVTKQGDDYVEDGEFSHEKPTFTVLSARPLLEIDQNTVDHVCIFRVRNVPTGEAHTVTSYFDAAIYMKDGYKPAQRHEEAGTFTKEGPTYGFVMQGRDPGIIWQSGWFTDPAKADGQKGPFPAAPADIYVTLTGSVRHGRKLQTFVKPRTKPGGRRV
ncbi:hypothetical protein [Kordiimonas aestuarii]|uniref:hypothetical protein n=1 Tax=Kordiimonas aestuarii TaxID=1005925 RepID=UPI0021D05BDA|nr:hypothetical protein [Kordiimonas aestuarii]